MGCDVKSERGERDEGKKSDFGRELGCSLYSGISEGFCRRLWCKTPYKGDRNPMVEFLYSLWDHDGSKRGVWNRGRKMGNVSNCKFGHTISQRRAHSH